MTYAQNFKYTEFFLKKAAFDKTRRLGWPMTTLLLTPAEGWGALLAPRAPETLLGAFSLSRLQYKNLYPKMEKYEIKKCWYSHIKSRENKKTLIIS